LQENRIHELPIVDEESVLVTGILRMTSILKFFVDNFIETGVSFEVQINNVPIGTTENIA